ncbi:uncharacterized protein LOC123531236 [Mercenaria mercenaria]|uniref:uncharacterized protein LOC123531236 n=1 Tax=Mercenaria mercenaria TaxID=6596 RepID=UPI001E1DD6D2|nr:uncharacterized protein LOC123531236 [Mercenaria mercenaria]XP_045167971.1 uncharacterized protein LOC123531236 [Mercenaria mercenaria]XP_045167972.1 uncharacterized protein LOC123531236 [Mercenaria mercenaria]
MFVRVYAVCLLLVMFSLCETSDAVRSTNNDESICSGSKCGKYSYKKILKLYPGLFYTQKQIAVKERKFSETRLEYLKEQGVDPQAHWLGDGDACCPTEIKSFTNSTMENVYGETKYIIHTPPKYQFIPHGFCIEGGTCDGKCATEPVTHSLLTYNVAKKKLEFDLFVVPGYCSCKAS